MNTPRKTSLILLVLLSTLIFPLGGLLRQTSRTLAQETAEPEPSFTPPASVAAGTTLRIDGSTSMGVINRALEQGFEERYPGTDITIQSSGTDEALQALLQGNLDLAAVGRPLSDEERDQGLVQVPISREKIAIIVGQDNPFKGDIRFDSFVQIFRGEITNWSQLGGPNVPIRFIDRPLDSDTRQALSGYEVFRRGPFETGSTAVPVEVDDTATVVRALGKDGISYAIASQVLNQDNVRVVTMDGARPSDSSYPYSQPRGYVYRGEPSIPVEAFLGYATNPDGKAAVAEAKADEAAAVATAELPPGQLAISPDGQLTIRGTQDGRLEWYDGQGNALGITVPAHAGLVTGLLFTPDGQTILSSSADGTIRRWDLQGNPVGQPLQGSDGAITALALSPDGQQIVSGNNDGSVQKWSAAGQPLGSPIQAHQAAVRALAFGPGGKLITGSSDASVRLWNPDGTAAGDVADVHPGGVTALAHSPNGQFLVSGGEDGSLQFWDAAGAPKGSRIPAHTAAVTSIAINPDSQTIASAGQDNLLRLWDPDGNPKAGEGNPLPGPASDLAFKPDGNLMTGLADGELQQRNAQGQLIAGEIPDLPGNPNVNLPPEISRVLASLPRSTWWIIPAIPILLILIGLLWSLFGGRKAPQDDEPDTEAGTDVKELSPTSPVGGRASGGVDGSYGSTPSIPPESSWVGLDPGAGEDLSLGDKLEQAKVDLAEGTRLAREGRYDDGLNRFNSAIEAAEVERMKAIAMGTSLGGVTLVLAQAMARRGDVLAVLGRSDRALESFNRALEMDTSSIEAWVGKGRLQANMGQFDEALFSFDQALELDPNSGPAWAGKGRTLVQMGQQQEGQTCLDRALELGGDQETEPVVTPAPGWGGGAAPVDSAPLPSAQAVPGSADPVMPELAGADVPSADVPPDLQEVTSLPSAESLPHPTVALGDPDVPPAMQAVVVALPDDPEIPEHAFITADQINNPDDLDPGLIPPPILVPQPAQPPVVPAARVPVATAPAPVALDEISLPAPEDLDELNEALQASIDLSAITGPAVAPPADLPPDLPPGLPPGPPPELPPDLPAEASAPALPTELPLAEAPLESTAGLEPPSSEPTLATPEPGDGVTAAAADVPTRVPIDSPESAATGASLDNPDSLSDLPPEVLAALRSIPSDSPDYIAVPDDSPEAPAPTPPNALLATSPPNTPPAVPANPRLTQRPPDRADALPMSWLTLSVHPGDERLYAVWDITDWERTAAQQSGGEALHIRLYDITGQSSEGPLPNPIDDQECYELAQDWYLALPKRDRTYVAEIGYTTSSQRWLSLARSQALSV